MVVAVILMLAAVMPDQTIRVEAVRLPDMQTCSKAKAEFLGRQVNSDTGHPLEPWPKRWATCTALHPHGEPA